MAPNSLLESYIDVVNENKQKLEKSFRKVFFDSRKNFGLKIFGFFRNMLDFQKIFASKFLNKFLMKSEDVHDFGRLVGMEESFSSQNDVARVFWEDVL